jgi:hypothetical protein
LKDVAEMFVLFLRSAQLVLRVSILTKLDLEVDVTFKYAEIFRKDKKFGEGRFKLGNIFPVANI